MWPATPLTRITGSPEKFGLPADKVSIKEHTTSVVENNETEKIVKGLFERSEEELGRKEEKIMELQKKLDDILNSEIPYIQITREAKTQYPEIEELLLSRGASVTTDSLHRKDCLTVIAKTASPMKEEKKESLSGWLKVRLGDSTVVVINQY